MKSMTGFGRSEQDASYGKIIAEIQSVNRKYLEIYVSLPKEFGRFENNIRKLVTENVQRGLLSVRIHVLTTETLIPEMSLLKSMKENWTQVATKLGFAKECIDFPFLIAHAEQSHVKLATDEDFDPIRLAIIEALQALDEMKSKEGAALSKDIASRLKFMSRSIDSIEKMAPDAVAKMRQKLKERMEELFAPGAALDERLLREVAFFAERVDITEEITRFRSHISQYEDLLRSKTGASGRKMDFLVQEMGREINTIGSKSADAALAHLVVEMKAELEKVREQIQNIE